jgi:thiosulfate/3-mercaptopyruvate sulfurtransferase
MRIAIGAAGRCGGARAAARRVAAGAAICAASCAAGAGCGGERGGGAAQRGDGRAAAGAAESMAAATAARARFGPADGAPRPIVARSASPRPGPWRGAAKDGVGVPAEWLARNLRRRDVAIVDARPGSAYAEGHIPGALSLPGDSLAGIADEVAAGAAFGRLGLRGDERIVCVTDTAAYAPAARLFWLLELAGAARVGFLDGGIDAWRGRGGALDAARAARPPAAWTPNPSTARVATRADLLERYGQPGYEILDARPEAEWEGRSAASHAASRAGHVPHSLPFPVYTMFRSDGTFPDPDTLLAVLRRSGPRPSTPLDLDAEFLVYDDGRSSDGALGYVLLRYAGIDPLRYWPGGWAEWAADTALPFTRIVGAEELVSRIRRKANPLASKKPSTDLVLLDVRERHDFDLGHIRGAVLLPSYPFADSLETVLADTWPSVDRAHVPCVVYCYGVECIRSRICTTIAARHGFVRLEWFRGGMDEWERAGGEVVR